MNNNENTRRRRRKPTPSFSQVGVLSTVREVELYYNRYSNGSPIPLLETSIYVNYIPLTYLAQDTYEADKERYINYDEPKNVMADRYGSNTRFDEFSNVLKTTGRRIYKSIGSYTLIHNGNPHIVACILPENLVYQRLYILKEGKIDLSKVIILIDKQLDETSFPENSIRTLYRTELLPQIVQTSCTVFKVPLDFIKDNCFYKKDMLPINIEERRRFKQEMLEDFRNSKKSPIPTIVTSDITEAPLTYMNTSSINELLINM